MQAAAYWTCQKCQPLVYEEICFLWGDSYSKWKPTHALDWFFQLWKRPSNILQFAYHESHMPSIMMIIIASAIVAMQLLLSHMHLQSLLRFGSVLRIVLVPAFENNQLTKLNHTKWDPACQMGWWWWQPGVREVKEVHWVGSESMRRVCCGFSVEKPWNQDQGESLLNCGPQINPAVRSHLSTCALGLMTSSLVDFIIQTRESQPHDQWLVCKDAVPSGLKITIKTGWSYFLIWIRLRAKRVTSQS